MLKCLVCVSGTAVRVSAATASAAHRSLPLAASGPTPCTPGSATTRPFARSLWMTSSGADGASSSGFGPKLFGANIPIPSTASRGRRGLHTEGDTAFADFLSGEIKEEKKIQKSKALPTMSGGWVLKANGTEAKLTRFISGDEVTVTFNVNDNDPLTFDFNVEEVEEEADQGQQKSAENEPEIVSTPNFVVEVTKRSASPQHSLVFDCHYPDGVGRGDGEEGRAIFDIREVRFQPEGDADWRETSYTLNTDLCLSNNLYGHLMDLLADRGVDDTFADELVELSAAIQRRQHISFLEQFGAFVKCN